MTRDRVFKLILFDAVGILELCKEKFGYILKLFIYMS